MISGLMGYKIGMTQIFSEDGKMVPVTVLQMGPCTVSQMKTIENDGYLAAQICFDPVAEYRVTKPIVGHFKKAQIPPARHLKEFIGDLAGMSVGDTVTVDIFKKGDRVDVTGVTKGKGFQGVMKRHNFAGGPATHGSMFHRAPGSIGASSFPSRVFKNKKMPGHMGVENMTIQAITVVEVRPDEHLLFLNGAVPGSPKGLVMVNRSVPWQQKKVSDKPKAEKVKKGK